MKAWITKHAFTIGIVELEGEVSPQTPSLFVSGDSLDRKYYHGEGRNWHRTREAAVTRANRILEMRLKSIKKQLSKLESMKFQ